MSLVQAILLGILQGLTEFIPVSSSGHLVLIPWLLGWDDPGLTYNTVVHLGTLLAVALYFWRDIVTLLRGLWRSLVTRRIDSFETRLPWLIVLATIPAALAGYLAEDFVEELFGTPRIASVLLIVTGLILVVSERLGRKLKGLTELSVRDAVWIGLAQAAAIAPGLYRSGTTIAAGLWRDQRRPDSARFSFLIALPVIAGAGGLQLAKTFSSGLAGAQWTLLIGGFLSAFLSGYLAIRFLLRYIQTHNLRPFAYYCWAIGLLGIILSIVL
jgi:undecaprenyl-diphosphatase